MFKSARLTLTILYMLIVAIIVFGFSIFLYQSIGRNLQDASDDDFAGHVSHQHFVQHTLDSIQYEIIFADLIIIVTSAGLSYMLAGWTLQPIQKSVEAQKAFAANASHELRTPLAVIRNDTEVFLRNPAQSKELAVKTMESNMEEVDRMSGIVENLLLLARSDNGLKPSLETVDLTALLHKMVEKIKPLAEKKNIQIDFTPKETLAIRGNSSSLERAILNLLQNSIEHSSSLSLITIETSQKDSQVVIKVIDTGAGIDEKDLPHVFTRFYKSETSSGSGLGLSIVKEIIDYHAGEVAIESVKNKGTTVTVIIPLT